MTIKDALETVLAIELLEYHDKNYLTNRLGCNPGECSREKINLLNWAIKEYVMLPRSNINFGSGGKA